MQLDIKDDFLEYEGDIKNFSLDEDKEFEIEILYMRIFEFQNEQIYTLHSTKFPNELIFDLNLTKESKPNEIKFYTLNEYIGSILKIQRDSKTYFIEVTTKNISKNFDYLIYSLLFLTPIIIFFSILFGNIFINRTFKPLYRLLLEINSIQSGEFHKRVEIGTQNDEIVLIAKELNRLLDRLEDSYNQISQFSSNISHEFKTPLTIIRGEIEITLRANRENREYKETLKSVLNEVISIQALIENLLFLAKVDFLPKSDVVYIDELLIDCVKEAKKLAIDSNIKILLDIDETLSIDGSEVLLRIAIKNILENAIFYSNRDSNILVKFYKHENLYTILIEDFGIGMNPIDIENIFNRCYRSNISRIKHNAGSGLGMSIVKKILDLHSIDIKIESIVNIGTKIYLNIDSTCYLDSKLN